MIVSHIAREQITVAAAVIGLDEGGTVITGNNLPRLRYADLQVQGQQVRATFDGTDPVRATTGQLWNPGDLKRIWGVKNMKDLEMIRESATTSATVVVDYWGEA